MALNRNTMGKTRRSSNTSTAQNFRDRLGIKRPDSKARIGSIAEEDAGSDGSDEGLLSRQRKSRENLNYTAKAGLSLINKMRNTGTNQAPSRGSSRQGPLGQTK